MVQIEVSVAKLSALCQRRHISRLALFGSVLRDDFRPESDIDVLVEFEPGRTPGFAFVSIQEELSAILGNHPVDLVSPKFLHHRIRNQVLKEAILIYRSDELSRGRALD